MNVSLAFLRAICRYLTKSSQLPLKNKYLMVSVNTPCCVNIFTLLLIISIQHIHKEKQCFSKDLKVATLGIHTVGNLQYRIFIMPLESCVTQELLQTLHCVLLNSS